MGKISKIKEKLNLNSSARGGLGIVIFGLFVLSSVIVSRTVQALNLAAGNYGYYGGTYGYNAATTSSDFAPSAPTSLSTSNQQQTSITVAWTSPTTTTGGTSYDNAHATEPYLIHYSTSAQSGCSGGTSTTSTSASVSLTSLTAGTTYNVAVCAKDVNLNTSAALTGSFTTASSGGGTAATAGSTGGGGGAAGPTFPTSAPTPAAATPVAATPAPAPAITTPSVAPAVVADAAKLVAQLGVTRNTAAESSNSSKVASSATEFKVTLAAEVKTVAANFVTYGTSSATIKLGSGERLALVRDALDTLGSVANNSSKLQLFLEQTAAGQKPTVRNLSGEQKQVQKVLPLFVKLVGRAPNFKDAKEDLAWNTLQYRVRFTRDLVKEKTGIVKFKAIMKRNPKSPLDWAVVRAWGYALK